jgi:hypothetical protein
MEGIVLNESEFNLRLKEIYREEQFKILNEKWLTLSKNEKTFVLEFYKVIYPEKSKLINESKWYNTIGDIAGIFDPTGVVDLVNGISYWKQDDKLFAILSWISVIPLLGDIIAKPVVGALKLGGDAVKGFRYAAAGKDSVKLAEAAKNAGGPIANLVEKSPSWGSRLLELLRSSVGKFPFIRKIVGLVEEFIKLFTTASKEMKVGSKLGKGLATAEKESLKTTFRGLRDYGGVKNKYFKYILSKDVPLWNKFAAGSPRLLGGNPATRSLMRRTKWYLGLLDSLGIVDSKTTPDELIAKYPNLDDKINQYNNTEVAQKNWAEEFGGEKQSVGMNTITPTAPTNTTTSSTKLNPIDIFIGSLFKA